MSRIDGVERECDVLEGSHNTENQNKTNELGGGGGGKNRRKVAVEKGKGEEGKKKGGPEQVILGSGFTAWGPERW